MYLDLFDIKRPQIDYQNKSPNSRTGGCHPLLKIDGWTSTRATRSNGGPASPTNSLRRNMYGGYEYAIKPNQLRLPYYFFEEKVLRGNGP